MSPPYNMLLHLRLQASSRSYNLLGSFHLSSAGRATMQSESGSFRVALRRKALLPRGLEGQISISISGVGKRKGIVVALLHLFAVCCLLGEAWLIGMCSTLFSILSIPTSRPWYVVSKGMCSLDVMRLPELSLVNWRTKQVLLLDLRWIEEIPGCAC